MKGRSRSIYILAVGIIAVFSISLIFSPKAEAYPSEICPVDELSAGAPGECVFVESIEPVEGSSAGKYRHNGLVLLAVMSGLVAFHFKGIYW